MEHDSSTYDFDVYSACLLACTLTEAWFVSSRQSKMDRYMRPGVLTIHRRDCVLHACCKGAAAWCLKRSMASAQIVPVHARMLLAVHGLLRCLPSGRTRTRGSAGWGRRLCIPAQQHALGRYATLCRPAAGACDAATVEPQKELTLEVRKQSAHAVEVKEM